MVARLGNRHAPYILDEKFLTPIHVVVDGVRYPIQVEVTVGGFNEQEEMLLVWDHDVYLKAEAELQNRLRTVIPEAQTE